jgi:hypothetical protein
MRLKQEFLREIEDYRRRKGKLFKEVRDDLRKGAEDLYETAQ